MTTAAMCITRLEKGSNDWMRRIETGRKFWVALHAYIKRVIREFIASAMRLLLSCAVMWSPERSKIVSRSGFKRKR